MNVPSLSPNRFVRLTSVQPHPDYSLLLTFETGEQKCVDFRAELAEPIFAPLKNPALFMQAKAKKYGVIWNDEMDISAEALYEMGSTV
jgi:hypothetical protein